MATPGFPSSHTTSTTTKVSPLIWFDKAYVQTIPGLLKACVVGVNLLGFLLAMFGNSHSGRVGFFSFTSMCGFWISLALFALYAFHVVEKFHNWPWLLGEFVYCLVWSAFYFLASLLMLISGGVETVAGIFGFIAMCIYGYDAYLKYEAYRNGEIAQGERTTNAQPPV